MLKEHRFGIDPYGRPVNEYPYFSYSEMQFTLLLSPNEGKDDICRPGRDESR